MAELAYEEVTLEQLEWCEELGAFTYACPCGDLFQITGDELAAGEDIARCPSCSLVVRVLLDAEEFAREWAKEQPAGAEEQQQALQEPQVQVT